MLSKLTNLVLIISILIYLPPSPAISQGDLTAVILNEKREKIIVDHCIFTETGSNKSRLEVYYQVFNSALQFKPTEEMFKAEYDITVSVLDKKGKKIAGQTQEKSITAPNEAKSKSTTDFRTSQINLTLDPGKFDVRFTLKDKIADKSYSKEFRADARKLKDGQPHLSDILFAMAAGPADSTSDQFVKGNLVIVPSVNHSCGGDEESRLLFYIEIYPGDNEDEKVTVQTLLRRRKGQMVYRDTLTTVLDRPIVSQLREISIDEYAPGEYELEVELQGRRGKKLDEKKGEFLISWTEESLLEHNWSLIIHQIELIADSKELKPLHEATTVDERRKALKEFWAAKDPFAETPRNELKIEFYRRISYANEHFGYLGRPGWGTDRGRVLVRYGPPDQIDDFPFSLSTYPYQEWHYYKGGRYLKFTFVDDNHDGDYRLVYPFDGLWQTPEF
jgi:GWxTD domain-containing protein